jgi:ribonuclease P protein component
MSGSGARRRRQRLTRSGDFDRVFRRGSSRGNRFFVLYAFPRDAETDASAAGDEGVRLGVSVGRKVGGAVERNSVKRAIREAFWSLDDELPLASDFVVVARPEAAGLVSREGTAGATGALRELMDEAEERST